MLDDVVVDTNVLAHAANHLAPQSSEALAFLEDLAKPVCQTEWVLDENEAIISEYRRTMPDSSVGLAVLARLARTSRVKLLSRPEHHIRKTVQRLLPENKPDRRFLEMARQSDGRTLVSHDEDDFHPECREQCRVRLEVSVLDATTCRTLL